MQFVNNDQSDGRQNISFSGIAKYATADYGSAWATTADIAAALLVLYPNPINGDIAILRNTNGTDASRFYFYAGGAWETFDSTTIAGGSIATAKLAAGILSADSTGRALIATDFFDAATVLLKIADAAFAANAATRALFVDGIWTAAKLAATAKTHVLTYQVEDLAANADIADRVLFVAPAGLDVTLVSASIIGYAAAAGVDDSNTCVIKLSDGTNTIVEATYDTDPGFPAAGAATSLGALDGTYKVLSAGEKLYLSVTDGATANPPGFMLQVVYTVAEAA